MRLAMKFAVIGGLVLLLMLPMMSLRGLVHERMERALDMRDEIAQSSGHAQRIVGPLLLIAIEHARERTPSGQQDVGNQPADVVRTTEQRLLLPQRLSLGHALSTERRDRALFSALLYRDEAKLEASFDLPELDPARSRIVDLRLVLGLGDTRGLNAVALRWDAVELVPQPGTGITWLTQGIQAALPEAAHGQRNLRVSAQLSLTGTEALDWLPLADETEVSVSGDWPHPSFRGAALPHLREVGPDGFRASWRVSHLASAAPQAVLRCRIGQQDCPELLSGTFGLSLVEPVNHYRMSERALKYALLQLALVFGTVFLIEAISARAVHAMQYGLTGAALAMFFLLLLALSEHVGFGLAYLVAAAACVMLIASYLGSVLADRRLGWTSAGLLAALYALLYGLLQSEDYALLMGSVFLFAFLAAVMLSTRRLDWHDLSQRVLSRTAGADGRDAR